MADGETHSVVIACSLCPAMVEELEGGGVFSAEPEMDGFRLVGPTFEDGKLIEARASFEVAKRGGIPSELSLGLGEERRGRAGGEVGRVDVFH